MVEYWELLFNNNNNNNIIISDSVDDRDQKPRYGIEVLLNLSRYQPANMFLVMRELVQKRIHINKVYLLTIVSIRCNNSNCIHFKFRIFNYLLEL